MKLLFWFILVSVFICQNLHAQESLSVELNQKKFKEGDTIRMSCLIPAWEGTKRLGTLNVIIEDIEFQNKWRMRYPLVDGYCEVEWILPKGFPANYYTFHLALQPVFFQLNGKIKNSNKEDSIRYSLWLPKNGIISGVLPVSKEETFRMPRHIFSNQGTLYFTPYKVSKAKNTIDIQISTPLDSGYSALADTQFIVSIGKNPENLDKIMASLPDNASGTKPANDLQETLQGVTITGKEKTPIKKFEEQNTSGFFRAENSQVFSGLDGEFSGFLTILDYLRSRVAGLIIEKDTESFGGYDVSWRGEPTAFFIDEIPVDLELVINYPPSDIAMIKVLRPPFLGLPFGGSGGAISIYSKKAILGNQPRYKNRFVVNGFTSTESILVPKSRNVKD